MYKSLEIALQQNNINLPSHWDLKKSIEIMVTNAEEDLAEEFSMSSTKCKAFLASCMPNRPKGTSIIKYLKQILAAVGSEERILSRLEQFEKMKESDFFTIQKYKGTLDAETLIDFNNYCLQKNNLDTRVSTVV